MRQKEDWQIFDTAAHEAAHAVVAMTRHVPVLELYAGRHYEMVYRALGHEADAVAGMCVIDDVTSEVTPERLAAMKAAPMAAELICCGYPSENAFNEALDLELHRRDPAAAKARRNRGFDVAVGVLRNPAWQECWRRLTLALRSEGHLRGVQIYRTAGGMAERFMPDAKRLEMLLRCRDRENPQAERAALVAWATRCATPGI